MLIVFTPFAQTTPVITGNTSFCTGGSTTLSTALQPGSTYCWQNTSSSTTWQNVGAPGFTGGRSFFQSLAFNGNTPYVAYQDEDYGGKTSVMKFDGTNWVHVGIRGFSSGYSAFQNLSFIGSTPYVAFRDWGSNLNGKCTVMKFDGSNWVNVGNAGFTGGEAGWLSFAINGVVPYVAYQDEANNYAATVMKFDGTNWVNVGNPGFSNGSVNYMSLAFNNNTPYVAYADGTNSSQKTTVMKFDGINWVNVGNPQFTTGATRDQNLAFDGNTPYVAFMDDALNFKTSVMKFDGTNWVYVGNPGLTAGSSAHPSLMINNHIPYVAYQDDANFYKTTVMKYDGAAWVVVGSAGFSSGFANYQSLAFNGNTPYVAFADGTNDYKATVMKYELGCVGTNNSISINTPGTYTVTVTNSSGSATSSPVTVTEGAIPTVSCPENMEVCMSEPAFALTTGSPVGGVYSGPGVSNNQFNPALAGTGIKNITYTYTDPSTGCSNSCTFTINVKAAPVVNCNVGTMFVCLNQFPFILANVTPAGGIFSGTGVSDGRFNAAVAGVGDHTITYTVTDPSTGCSTSCSFTIHVWTLPAVSCNVGTMYVCANQAPFVLSNVSPAGGTFSGTGVSNGMFNASVAGVGSHTVTYTYTDSYTSCSNSCSFTVVVRPLPTVSCNGNISVCSSQAPFTLTNASPAGGTYSGTGVSNGVFNPLTAGVGTHTITYNYSDQTTSCGNSCSFTITVNNSTAPVITPVSNNIVLNLDASGNRTITLADIATLTGGCNSNPSVRFSPTTFNCSSVGTQNVFVEATDGIFGTPDPSTVSFSNPNAIATDNNGNFYVADRGTHTVRKISASGQVTLFAGSVAGYADGTGSAARFNVIFDLATDAAGNVYVMDAGNRRVRKITPAGVVTTIAGNGSSVATDGTGTSASFENPIAITVDNQGVIYVGDFSRIRKITSGNVVTTVAGTTAGFADGTGAAAKFWGVSGLTTDINGDLFIADGANYRIRKMTPAGVVTTIAGGSGQFGFLHAIALDGSGSIYVADTDNDVIKKYSYGVVSTLAGSGSAGNSDGTGSAASFSGPFGMAFSNGNLYVSDYDNNKIRKVSLPGVVTTFAGSGTYGSTNGNVGGITGNYTSLQIPVTIADTTAPVITPVSNNIVLNLDATGNKTITAADIVTISDNCNTNPTVTISPSSFNCSTTGVQTVTVEATDGTFATSLTPGASTFRQPYGITFDQQGNLFIADENNNRIRKIDIYGNTSTVAGSGTNGFADGSASSAMFSFPDGVAVDAAGNIYVGDDQNNRIRKITPLGIVSTFAGSGVMGSADGIGTAAQFNRPQGLAFDNAGNLYVADNNNHKIRKITPQGVVTTLPASLFLPFDVVVSPSGDIYVSEYYKVSKISPNGSVTTIAGTQFTTGDQDGPASTALFGVLRGIELDQAGNIYVSDNNNRKIKKITPAGIVETIASSGYPGGISFSPTGELYFTNSEHHTINKIDANGSVVIVAGIHGVFGTTNGNVGSNGTGNYISFQTTVTIKDVTAPVITPVSNSIVLNLDPSGNKTITATDIVTVTDNYNPAPLVRISPSSFNCTTTGIQTVTVEATDGSFATPLNPNAAAFGKPYGIVFDQASNLFVVDEYNQRIRKIAADGTTSTIAGNGTYGFADGISTSAIFHFPDGIAVDDVGNIYVGDDQNNRIRKITPAGVVSTFAGSGAIGNADGTGTNAEFVGPSGLAFDNAGNLYVADRNNHRIRKITPAGVVTTVATNILLPFDVAIAPNGDIYVAQYYKVSKISPNGIVTTVAGTDFTLGYQDGPANTALFGVLRAIELDQAGNIYVTDNNNRKIRKITPAGLVETIASSGYPGGIAFSPNGDLYFTDHEFSKIYKLNSDGSLQLIAGGPGYADGNVGSSGTGNYSSLQIPVTIKDVTAPVITCPADINVAGSFLHPNQTGWATATDNCSVTISYTDASNTNGGCFINRTWKATDASGNSSTCLQRIATTGLSVSLGPDMYIMYGALGYTGCRTITPVITGGVAPYTYSWTSSDPVYSSGNGSNWTVCHTSEVSYTYTLTVTSANGCSGSATVRLTFINISCSNNANNEKVQICHRPEGNPNNCKTICVPASAVQAFINSGSYYGQCLPGCAIPVQARASTGNTIIAEEAIGQFDVIVLGNPSSSQFTLKLSGDRNQKISLRITDATGRVVEMRNNIPYSQLLYVGQKFSNGVYMAELSQGDNKKVLKLVKQ
jgi:sugar lactone lactonase YvrE